MSKFFINRPIVAMVIAILMVIVGGVSVLSLPIAEFPDIVPTEIQITANYSGADATTMEQSVATPLEEQITGVDFMSYMYSVNSNAGQSRIYVDFNVKTNPDIDQVLTQLRTSQAQAQLPAQVNTAGLTILKSLHSPLMLIALSSPKGTYDSTFLANYAYINLVDELTRVPGIAQVSVFGAGQYAMRCWVNPDRLGALHVTVPQIISALQAQNTVNPGGQIGGQPVPPGQQFAYTVRTLGRLSSPAQFSNIILRSNPDGSTLRLKDVARLELGAQTYDLVGRYNGKPSAILALYQLPSTNAVDTVKGVRTHLAELAQRFPQDLTYTVTLDTTEAVTAGMREILITLLEALGLVILVVYVFLQNWRATIIPLMAVPVSLIGTFMVFPLLGFSINTLSLFGLVLAIGLVVDDAIVVVEVVERHIEEGMSPHDAALRGMEEVSGPVIAIALILAAVFVPTIFIPGITGRLYEQFAVTIAVSVVFSAFNALSLSPAMAALLLRPRRESRGLLARFFGWFNRIFDRGRERYIGISALLIRRSVVSVLFLVIVMGAAYLIFRRLSTSFVPEDDEGYIYVSLQLPDSASQQRTEAAAAQVADILLHVPGIQGVTSVIGFNLLSLSQTTYNAFFFVTEKPWQERKAANEQYKAITANITRRLAGVAAGTAFTFSPPAIPGIGTSGGVTFVLEDRSNSGMPYLAQNVDKFVAAARRRKELAAVITALLPSVPQQFADVDREKVQRQQVGIGDVYETLQTFLGGYLVNYFNLFGRQWQVYVEADGQYRTSPADLGRYYVLNSSGAMVPLSSVVTIRPINGPEFILRYNEYEAAQINALAAPGYSSGQAMKALEETFAQTMPRQMAYGYMGMSYQEQEAAQGISPLTVFGVSLLFVFLLLAALYESWSLPFSVLLSTPVAVFGATLALWGRHFDNDVYAQIGLVMLIGLSAKNAILIVEFAKKAYEKGTRAEEAALNGARIRLRPILMTAFAFILGVAPLWLASGAGAVSRRILGTTVIGGMLAATLLAIFVIPVNFYLVEKLTHRMRRQPPHAGGGGTA